MAVPKEEKSVSQTVVNASTKEKRYSSREKEKIKKQIEGKLNRHFAKTIDEATNKQLYKAVALTIRDNVIEKWLENEKKNRGGKKLYYLSFEFLVGRSLGNNLMNLGLTGIYNEVLEEIGVDLATVSDMEADAGLGNGGLGRLAACFMSSLATLGYNACGCGIRYEYGLFKQKIVDGYQIEMPDPWLEDGCVWEIERPEERVEVYFGGKVESYEEDGKLHFYLKDASTVLAIPYDMPIIGYDNECVNTLRLWSARSPKYLDMSLFSYGDYARASDEKELAEVLSKVLYPEDRHYEGKTLRLKQQYFFTSATLQWIVRGLKAQGRSMYDLPECAQIHINDTHPAIAIPELMRILMDEEFLGWDEAWEIVTKVFAYTNHTVMAEALEKWPQQMIEQLLPRIYMIIDELNRRMVEDLHGRFGDDWGKINYMSIIANGSVSMANLCLYTCHSVNGVSALHTEILKDELFRDYNSIYPFKFRNITNGITHRRWLCLSNPRLSSLIAETIGSDFIKKPEKLADLHKFAKDKAFQEEVAKVKRANKVKLANRVFNDYNLKLDPDSIFDTHAKRLHEYKRQLLNILHIEYLYNRILENPDINYHPHTFFFAAKASPGYIRAKNIIKLINTLADIINNDKRIGGKLKIVFMENYGVSLAQTLIPATEISQQISTAGKEASGTGNMKFMLNGAITLGTLDGANVEMLEQVGEKNIYIFGLRAEEVAQIYSMGNAQSQEIYSTTPHIKQVLDSLVDGTLDGEKSHLFQDLYQALLFGDGGFPDPYMVIRDFDSYVTAGDKIAADYCNRAKWNEMAIHNIAASGFFSSDRTINEYNRDIWRLR